jgi:hypothetical protein
MVTRVRLLASAATPLRVLNGLLGFGSTKKCSTFDKIGNAPKGPFREIESAELARFFSQPPTGWRGAVTEWLLKLK